MKRAIVLCGGGSMGSYEIGVWKFLNEINLDYDIVVGTSIGALNGALMSYKAYDEALELWESVSVGKVIKGGINLPDDFYKNQDFRKENAKKIIQIGKSYLKNKGVDIRPFKEWVKNAIDPHKIKNSKIPLGIVTTIYPGFKELDLIAQDLEEDQIIPFLHASSSCWPIFPMEKIGKQTYVDGGFTNNMAIDFAIKLGAEEIIAVMLPAFPKIPQKFELTELPFVKTIIPTRPLGTIMNFEKKSIKNNMELGYLDAGKMFGKYIGVKYTFENEKDLKESSLIFVNAVANKSTSCFPIIRNAFTSQLGKYIPKTNEDYYLSTLEFIGDACAIKYYKPYTLNDFKILIADALKEMMNNQKLMQKANRYNLSIKPQSKDKKIFVCKIYNDYKSSKIYAKLALIIKNNPIVGAVLSMFESMRKEGYINND